MEKEKKPMSAQKKTGILSVSITLAVVLCLVVLNVLAAVVTEKYPVKLDLTSDKVFQLSQDSIDYLSGMESAVEITVLNTRDGFAQGGDYFEQAMSVIEQYAKYNQNITIKFVDILANPAYTSQYPDLDLSINDILVQSGENTNRLTAYDIFNVETSWYGGSITSSKAEQAMTGAILNVTDQNKIKVAFLSGHGENGGDTLKDLLEKNGFETVEVSLQTEGVPEDASFAVMSAPRSDISADEAAALDKYLENGGAYGKNFFYFAALEQGELPNLETWLAKWGLVVGDGAVAETDPSRVVNQNVYFAIASIDDDALSAKMASTEIPIAVPFARPVEFAFQNNLGYATRTLLSYSEKSGIAGPEVQRVSDIQVSGPVTVAGISTLRKDGKESNVTVFGTAAILDQSLFESGSFSNADYFLSAVNTLTKRENVISIAPKVLGGGKIAVTLSETLLWGFLLAIVAPVAVLAAGLTIWTRRRHR